jgi:hypothetical protein
MPEKLRFEHFEVLTREDGSPFELGRGAMGITYKAIDTNLGSTVAIKVINGTHLQRPEALERFQREARAAAALRHPNVASVYHLGMEGDIAFYAMEFVDGETVEAFMKREGAVAPEMALEIACQVCRALAAAGKRGLVHRDIKPANLMLLRREGEELEVKVIDFGLAKPGEGSPEAATLTVGGFLGTPHFASPEQLEEKPLDIRSDLYSLGATLWFMLSGQTPYTGSLAQVMSGHLHASLPIDRLSGLPEPLTNLFKRLMAKNPGDRPPTASAAREEILACREVLNHLPASQLAAEIPADHAETPTEELDTSIMGADGPGASEVPPSFHVGSLIAGRYEITAPGTMSELGEKFPARRVADGVPCALVVVDAGLRSTSEALTRIEAAVEVLRGVGEEALIPMESLESVGPVSFLVIGECEGPTVLDLMRVRRVLAGGEVTKLLAPVARALDLLVSKGLPLPSPGLHSLILPGLDTHGPPRFIPVAGRVAGGVSADATFIGDTESAMGEGNPNTATPCQITAALAYEMLGGMRGPGGTIVPVPALSEVGNQLLRNAMDQNNCRFASATDFMAALSEEEPPIEEPPASAPHGQHPPPSPLSSAPNPNPPGPTKKFPLALTAGICLVAVLVAGGALWLVNRSGENAAISVSTPPPTPTPTPIPPARTAASVLAEAAAAANPADSINILLDGLDEFPGDEPLEAALRQGIKTLPESGLSPAEIAEMAPRIEGYDIPAPVARWIGDSLIKPDPSSAFPWIKRAADDGDPEALAQLADCYNHGLGTSRDMAAYVATLRLLAETDNASAINKLGDIMKRGIPGIVAPNPEEAHRLFTRALELGYLDAQGNLGILTREGLGTGTPPDEAAAAALFLDGAEKGNALCMFFYALCLELGSGVPEDQDAAKMWLQRSASLGHPRAIERCRELGIPP